MSLTRFMLAWRTIPLRDREVIDALVDPNHAGPSPEFAQALQALDAWIIVKTGKLTWI